MSESKKMGRPTKEEALSKAIAAFGGVGVDPALVDPRRVLASIAVDPAASESARIRACIVLMSDLVVGYSRRREKELSDADIRRQWDEADDATRAAMVEQAKAKYTALLS